MTASLARKKKIWQRKQKVFATKMVTLALQHLTSQIPNTHQSQWEQGETKTTKKTFTVPECGTNTCVPGLVLYISNFSVGFSQEDWLVPSDTDTYPQSVVRCRLLRGLLWLKGHQTHQMGYHSTRDSFFFSPHTRRCITGNISHCK